MALTERLDSPSCKDLELFSPTPILVGKRMCREEGWCPWAQSRLVVWLRRFSWPLSLLWGGPGALGPPWCLRLLCHLHYHCWYLQGGAVALGCMGDLRPGFFPFLKVTVRFKVTLVLQM